MTLADAQAQLATWLAASTKVAKGQSYEVAGGDGSMRRLTRVDAAEIREQIKFWEGRVSELALQASTGSNGSQVIYAGRVR